MAKMAKFPNHLLVRFMVKVGSEPTMDTKQNLFPKHVVSNKNDKQKECMAFFNFNFSHEDF